ncbi:MAG: hypothetical protein WD851_02710 [Pirellulales bacterium]
MLADANVMHNLLQSAKRVLLVLAVLLACRGASAQDDFEGWNLESSIDQAHLVMVARVESISKLRVVEGAKTDVTLREYRFQPIRILKGIFNRDQLSMTTSDLGCPPEDASTTPPLREGEFRLLILAQQSGQPFGSMGCVSPSPGAMTFEQRVPLLTGPDDPLVGVVETLIKVADSRSRRERAKLLVDRLSDVNGVAAVPILTSLKLRSDLAAADDRAYPSLARLARDPSTAVRGAALDVLSDMLASRNIHREQKQLDDVADKLREILDSDESHTQIRVAALEALGHLLVVKGNIDWAQELLTQQMTAAATYAERAEAVTALSRIAQPVSAEGAALLDAVALLPLDESPDRETIYARAALRLLPTDDVRQELGDQPISEKTLLTRLKRSVAARQSLEAEIDALGKMRSKASLPLLLTAAGQPSVSATDRYRIAWALGRLSNDRAVPVLIGWMRGNDYQLKEAALAALESLDSQVAAQEARPLLRTEAFLPYKLRLARLLARHGFADGYALATEHLADDDHTAAATLVLVALDDARTSDDLSAIVADHPDRRWYAATLTGLAAIGNADALKQVREVLADDRNPLVADAAKAAGLSADSELLLPLAKLVQSRNKQIAMSSLVALRRFLTGVRLSPRGLAAVDVDATDLNENGLLPSVVDLPAETRAAIAEAVASLAVDAYVDTDVRQEALAVVRLLGGDGLNELLSDLADQAELEGTPLLAEVQKAEHGSKGSVTQP